MKQFAGSVTWSHADYLQMADKKMMPLMASGIGSWDIYTETIRKLGPLPEYLVNYRN